MGDSPSYTANDSLFRDFYSVQSRMTLHLARHPRAIGAWLESQPGRRSGGSRPIGRSKFWRTARLSGCRRRELARLLVPAAAGAEEAASELARWLLASVPVRTYFDMADAVRPSLRAVDPQADECCRELCRRREEIFKANYGLAKSAAFYGAPQDYDDRLSAASSGLLDAVDRYVPGEHAARFAYFASYWIRYHLGRNAQKCASLVVFPVHQFRVGRRIERYLASRSGGPAAAGADERLCAELKVSPDAYYWHQHRPKIVSLDAPAGDRPYAAECLEYQVCEPPEPLGSGLDEAEARRGLRAVLRRAIDPADRVILAYVEGIGELGEAAEDYLRDVHQSSLSALDRSVRGLHREPMR